MKISPILLNGVAVYPFRSTEELLDHTLQHPGILVAVNAEKILHATDETRTIINSGIGYCDGIGAVMALKRKGYPDVIKIAGCDLWLEIIARTYTSKSIYLVGAKPEVIKETVTKLQHESPGLQIRGYRDGYIKKEDENALLQDIAAKKPDLVFVAMGSPRQEYLMQRMQQQHPEAIYQGLGGSFDVYTGHVERAPQWWIDHKLEFAYRLLKQPTRIKRQIHLIRFLFLLITNRI